MLLRTTKLLIVVLVLCPLLTESFASWLVNQEISCYRDLKAGEVVMNNAIVDASASRYPNIRLQASGDTSEIVEFEAGEQFTLTISVPYQDVHDLQYVVETAEGGKMTGAGSGCEGRRASAKNGEEVTLSLSGETDTVHVWAGWATSHEAVTLTPPLIFHKREQVAPNRKEETGKPETDPQQHIHPRRKNHEVKQHTYRSHRSHTGDEHKENNPKLRAHHIPQPHRFAHHRRALHRNHAQFLEFASDSPFLTNLAIGALVLVFFLIFVKFYGDKKEKGKHDL